MSEPLHNPLGGTVSVPHIGMQNPPHPYGLVGHPPVVTAVAHMPLMEDERKANSTGGDDKSGVFDDDRPRRITVPFLNEKSREKIQKKYPWVMFEQQEVENGDGRTTQDVIYCRYCRASQSSSRNCAFAKGKTSYSCNALKAHERSPLHAEVTRANGSQLTEVSMMLEKFLGPIHSVSVAARSAMQAGAMPVERELDVTERINLELLKDQLGLLYTILNTVLDNYGDRNVQQVQQMQQLHTPYHPQAQYPQLAQGSQTHHNMMAQHMMHQHQGTMPTFHHPQQVHVGGMAMTGPAVAVPSSMHMPQIAVSGQSQPHLYNMSTSNPAPL